MENHTSNGGKREFGFSWADDVDHEFYGGNPSAVAYAEVETANKVTDPKTGPTTSLSSGENSPTEKEVEKLADPAGMVPANGSSQTPHDPWWEESSSGQKSHKASVSHDPSINPTVDEGEYSLEWRPSVVNFNPAGPTPLPQSKTRNRRRFKQHSKQTGAVRPSYEWYELEAARDPFLATMPKARSIMDSTEPVKVVEDLWADHKKKPLNLYE